MGERTETITCAVDAAVRRREAELERLLGAVAHGLGAVMLPSLVDDPERATDRGWKRLHFVAGTLSEHVLRQKKGLDFVRGRTRGELECIEQDEWNELVPPVLAGVATHGEPPRVALSADVPVGLLLTRAVTRLSIALDEQRAQPRSVEVTVLEGRFVIAVETSPGTEPVVPQVVSEGLAALDGEHEVERRDGRVVLSGRYRGES